MPVVPLDFLATMATLPHPSFQLPRYLSQSEVTRLFGVIPSVRDLALFAFMYHYGLRVSEVALHVRSDLDLERRRIVVKRVKGGVWAERPLFASTEHLIRVYLADAGLDHPGFLFPGRSGPLKKRQIQSLFDRYRTEAGIPEASGPHTLRHSIATHLLDAGASLEFVQDHLGHRRIESTSIYARITDRHREAVFRGLEASPWIVHPAVTQQQENQQEALP